MVWPEKIFFTSLEEEIPQAADYRTTYSFNTFALLDDGTVVAVGKDIGDKEKEIAIFYASDTLNKLNKYNNISYEFLAQQVLDKLKKTKGIDVERTYGYYILNVANKLDSINYNISSNNESNNKMLNIDVSMFDEKDIEDIKKYIEFLRSKK